MRFTILETKHPYLRCNESELNEDNKPTTKPKIKRRVTDQNLIFIFKCIKLIFNKKEFFLFFFH